MTRLCSIEGCGRRHRAKGFCDIHYRASSERPPCSIPDCDQRAYSEGLCQRHKQRLRRWGDPLGGRQPNGEIEEWVGRLLKMNSDECIAWPYMKGRLGYGRWHRGGQRGKSLQAHREICTMVHGQPPSPKHQAAHSCGKGHLGCVNPRHLRWATAAENAADRYIHGTILRGERSPAAKLKPEDVLYIRQSARKGVNHRVLAETFGLHKNYVRLIVVGTRWKHLPL